MKWHSDQDFGQHKEPHKKKKTIKSTSRGKDLIIGRVLSLTPEQVTLDHENEEFACHIKGTLKKELKQQKNRLCPGDLVYFDPKSLQIVTLKDRKTKLTRENPSQKFQEQILAANIDLLLVTASVVEPKLNPYLIDLYILSAGQLGLTPIVLINKMDLLDSSEEEKLANDLKEQYEKLGIRTLFVSAKSKKGFKELQKMMQNKASVFSGASGVGKSSLINALEKVNLKVSKVSPKNLKGVHTTTTSTLLKLKKGGFCIDTPGVQSLGFKKLEPIEIRNLFPELTDLGCQFSDCLHQEEKGCQIQQALEKKEVSHLRLESYYRLLSEKSS